MSTYYDECRHVDPTGADRDCPCQDDVETEPETEFDSDETPVRDR